jgi:hypothetical protein
VTFEERAKVYEELRELAKTMRVPVIVAQQPPPGYRGPPEWNQRPDIIFIDGAYLLRGGS